MWFHPDVNPDDVYGSLQDNVTAYLVVHVGTLVFIGLMGAALYLLVRTCQEGPRQISRLAIGPFVVLYAAWEAVIGIAIGTWSSTANDAHRVEGETGRGGHHPEPLGQRDIGDAGMVGSLGALAWAVAAIAAAVAYRNAGAPTLAWVLLATVVAGGVASAAHRTDRVWCSSQRRSLCWRGANAASGDRVRMRALRRQ